MTDKQIAEIAGVSRQAVTDARAKQSQVWVHRYALIAEGHPDPGTTEPKTAAARAASRAGLTKRDLARAIGVSPRHLARAYAGDAPIILAKAEAHLASLPGGAP